MKNEDVLALMALSESEAVETEIEQMDTMGIADFEPDGSDGFLAFGPTGHGLASWRFRLRLKTPSLDFDFALPCLRVLADEESRKADADDVKTVCKLVVAAIRLAGGEQNPKLQLVARAEPETGCAWRLEDARGERTGEGWRSLVDVIVGLGDGQADDTVKIYG